MTDVLVVGSVNVDVVVRVPRFPEVGETLFGRDVLRLAGGKGANQAVALARLGLSVSLAGAVGRDADGDLSLAALGSEGIDVTAVARADAATGMALITVDDAGENTIVVVPGANADVRAPSRIEARAVVVQLEVPLPVVVSAVATARSAGALVVLNAAPAQPLPAELLRDVDVLVVNAGEAAALSGRAAGIVEPSGPAEAGAAAQALRPLVRRGVVVTLGADGALVCGDDLVHVPGLPAVAVDTVGAGDAFVGALTWALLDGLSLERAASIGCRAGAWTVAHRGARSSPTLAQLR